MVTSSNLIFSSTNLKLKYHSIHIIGGLRVVFFISSRIITSCPSMSTLTFNHIHHQLQRVGSLSPLYQSWQGRSGQWSAGCSAAGGRAAASLPPLHRKCLQLGRFLRCRIHYNLQLNTTWNVESLFLIFFLEPVIHTTFVTHCLIFIWYCYMVDVNI